MRDAPAGIVTILLAAGRGSRLGGPKALLLVRTAPASAERTAQRDAERTEVETTPRHDTLAPPPHSHAPEIPGASRESADVAPRTLLEAQCLDRLGAESDRVIAVVREDVAERLRGRLPHGVELVISRAPDEDGPKGSLAAAAIHLGNEPFRAAVVTPVDVRVEAPTVRQLIEALIEVPIDRPPEAPLEATRDPGSERPENAVASTAPVAAVPRFAGRRGHPVVLGPEALARYREPSAPTLRDHLRAFGERVAAVDVDDPTILEDLDFAHQTATLRRLTGSERPAFLA